MRYFIVVFAAVLTGGCASTVILPDGTEMPEDVYVQTQAQAHSKALFQAIESMSLAPDEQMSAEGEVAHEIKQIVLAVMLPQIAQNPSKPYFAYKSNRDRIWGNIAQTGLYVLAPSILAELGIGAVGGGGSSFEENITITDSNISSGGGQFTGGSGAAAPGGAGAGGEGAGTGGAGAGGDGAPASGSSNSIVTIGGFGHANGPSSASLWDSKVDKLLFGEGNVLNDEDDVSNKTGDFF